MISILVVGSIFIIWDVYFTKRGVWDFNRKYLIGLDIFGLPIEEILFFVCIPYACIFTYKSLKYFKKGYIKFFCSRPISIFFHSYCSFWGLFSGIDFIP